MIGLAELERLNQQATRRSQASGQGPALTPLGPVYRLIVGKPLADVERALISQGVQGATLTPARGFWRGVTEDATQVEIAWGESQAIGSAETAARGLAGALCTLLNQEAVYFATPDGQAYLIGPGYGV